MLSSIDEGPYTVKTVLGWVISGPLDIEPYSSTHTKHVYSTEGWVLSLKGYINLQKLLTKRITSRWTLGKDFHIFPKSYEKCSYGEMLDDETLYSRMCEIVSFNK